MKVLEIKNIARKDMPISYRRIYAGDVVLENRDHEPFQIPIEFVLEHVATGGFEVQVAITDERVADATRDAIAQHVETLEKNGQLP